MKFNKKSLDLLVSFSSINFLIVLLNRVVALLRLLSQKPIKFLSVKSTVNPILISSYSRRTTTHFLAILSLLRFLSLFFLLSLSPLPVSSSGNPGALTWPTDQLSDATVDLNGLGYLNPGTTEFEAGHIYDGVTTTTYHS